jgi:hypothetical protein
MVRVEEGTVGLTASVPVTCFGRCDLISPGNITTDPYGFDTVQLPPETEVLLAAGDVALFEDDDADATHVYRNAGIGTARFMSTVTNPTAHKGRCGGRCFDAF